MASSTDIANLALGRIGIGQAIASLNDSATPARVCNRFFTHCRQEVLRAHPWGFASTTQSIAEVANQTFPGWEFVYQYPTKALMIWAVADENGIRNWSSYYSQWCCGVSAPLAAFSQRYPFKLSLKADNNARVILSDVEDAYAYFTYDVDTAGVYPPDFVSVLAWRLAMEISGPLKVDANMMVNARNEYLYWKSQAAAQDMNEQRDDQQPDSPSISCRY